MSAANRERFEQWFVRPVKVLREQFKAPALVTRYGIHLLPELYEHLNPMPYNAAAKMEVDLAGDLRRAG